MEKRGHWRGVLKRGLPLNFGGIRVELSIEGRRIKEGIVVNQEKKKKRSGEET